MGISADAKKKKEGKNSGEIGRVKDRKKMRKWKKKWRTEEEVQICEEKK